MLMDALYIHTHSLWALQDYDCHLYLSRRHQFIQRFVNQMHRTDIENGGFIFVCSPDSNMARGWWGSVWKRREQKTEQDKDRRRQRVLRAGAAERWYTIVIDHKDSKQLRMCVYSVGACEGLNFPLLWRVFMPTYVFVGEGRCQCNVTPVQIKLIIAGLKCVWSLSLRLSSLMENIMKTKT